MQVQDRLERLEKELAEVKLRLEAITPKRWVSPKEASRHLGTTSEALIRKIKSAIVFPEKSPYQEGLHWKLEVTTPVDPTKEGTVRYKINLSEWGKV